MIFNTFFILFLFFSHVYTNKVTIETFHTIFQFIHNDPCILKDVFGLDLPNYIYPYCEDKTPNNLYVLDNLQYSSLIHIERIVDEGCPFSHSTCNKYCKIYNSCDFYDRIKYYLDYDIEVKKLGEVLMKDNNLDSVNVIRKFINTPSHAKVILDKEFNFFGIAHYDNLFNMNFLKANNIESEELNLKTVNFEYEHFNYIFTTIENCNLQNLIYNNSNMYIYQMSNEDE